RVGVAQTNRRQYQFGMATRWGIGSLESVHFLPFRGIERCTQLLTNSSYNCIQPLSELISIPLNHLG
ncbi:hypothetical protein SB717_35315, partial [Priestia sp. SIMBA_032]|uniref:hypothetical protein n=1 Tax=Priestia sp. SIMBA_032 TaxID=3085775 RepID=UPI00397845E5